MILTIGVFVIAAIAALLAWGRLGPALALPGLQKENYRGVLIFAFSGIFVVALEVIIVINLYWGFRPSLYGSHVVAVLILVLTFGVLGWVDDTRGGNSGGGFEGHLRSAVSQRTVSTGLVKLVGGVLVSLAAVLVADISDGLVEMTRCAAIIALSANLLNLFDRAPARSSKISLFWFVILLVSVFIWGDSYSAVHLVWAAGVVGASVGLAPAELMERHMQGDTGVNATGAILGFSTVLVSASTVQWVVLLLLAGFNLASEQTSFSQVIADNALLSRVDRAGTRQPKT
ncbi:MAG: hypothetical protein MKZ67_07620 [Acidimicrobiales bacterium]|nr:hypothetical protein [Acidimicrobiales bacterium]